MSRPLAETIPAVTVPPRPKGLPTASTQSPIRGLASDSFVNGKSEPPSTLISARSVRASVTITLALKVLPSSVVTSTLSAPSTTWLLVTEKPSAETTEETFHRRSRLKRRGVVVVAAAIVLGDLLVDIDLHRNHGRFNALDDVGKADRLSDLADLVIDLRMGAGGEDIDGAGRRAEAVNRDTKAGYDRR